MIGIATSVIAVVRFCAALAAGVYAILTAANIQMVSTYVISVRYYCKHIDILSDQMSFFQSDLSLAWPFNQRFR